MPEDSTRRLLRVFGIAVTECEDAVAALEAAVSASVPPDAVLAALEAHDRAARELEARWADLARLVREWQARARRATLAHARARGGA